MRRLPLIILLVAATPCFGAIQYEFTQVTRSDSQLSPAVRLVARAVVDGDRSRVDYLEGSTVGAGNYVVSTNGARDILIVNTENQTYARRYSTDASRRLDTLGVKLSNLKVDLSNPTRGPNIAGYPTTYWRLIANYDITLMIGSIPISQHITATVEKWTTDEFGEIFPSFFTSSSYRTGDPELDRLIDAETTRIKGFPLKQIISVSSRLTNQPASSILHGSSRNQKTEILVTRIGRSTVEESYFSVPAGFHEATDEVDESQKGGLQVLSMDEEEPKKDNR